jgi:hypothetical protein
MLNVPASSLSLYQAPADLLREGGWQVKVVRSNGDARGGVRMLWLKVSRQDERANLICRFPPRI